MISLRLKTIAKMIDKCQMVADIGCDHGYLSIYLIKKNIAKKVIACDINQNALNNAIKNIKQEKLGEKIRTFLSDGIDDIDVNNINTIVISGMGSTTIKHILRNPKSFNQVSNIIIQSNNDLEELRKYMISIGYYISDEKCVYENKKFYVIIKFKFGKTKYSKKEIKYGPILIKDNPDYFKRLRVKQQAIYKNMPKHKLLLRFKFFKEIVTLNAILKDQERKIP